MRISITESSYNERRYSRPWIGRVTAWPIGGRPELSWGGYAGDDQGGELEIEANPGDLIRWGQKDGRGNGGRNCWGIANDKGSVDEVDQPEARKQWDKLQAAKLQQPTPAATVAVMVAQPDIFAGITDEQLLTEIRRRGLTVKTENII